MAFILCEPMVKQLMASSLAARFSLEREPARAALPAGPDTGTPARDRLRGQPSTISSFTVPSLSIA
jgi:hypothetical protein